MGALGRVLEGLQSSGRLGHRGAEDGLLGSGGPEGRPLACSATGVNRDSQMQMSRLDCADK